MSILARFKTYDIATKLKVPVIVLAVIIAFSSLISLISTRVLSASAAALANEYLPSLDLVLQADRDLHQAQVAERSVIFMNARAQDFADMVTAHEQSVLQSRDRVLQFIEITQDSSLKEQANHYLALHQEWSALTHRIKDERVADTRIGRTNAMELSFGPAYAKFQEMRKILETLGSQLRDKSVTVVDTTNHAEVFAYAQQLLCTLIALMTCVFLIKRFPAFILEPLNALVSGMKHVRQQGDFKHRIHIDCQDEIGDAAKQFNELVESLESIIAQCEAAVSAVAKGNFEKTIAVNFKGDLNRLASGINSTIVSIQEAMKLINEITQDLAEGNFKQRTMVTLSGEFNRTIANANHAKHSLSKIIEECSTLIHQIAEGDFSQKITRDYPGDLHALKRGVNSTLEGMATTMATIREAMSALEQGNFKYHSQHQLAGQFAITVNSVINAMGQLNQAIQDITLVMNELMQGHFDKRVTIAAKGDIDVLKNSINGSINVVETTTLALRTVMSAIAEGDLSRYVNLHCEGSFDQLKQDMNRTIKRLTDDMSNLKIAAHEVAAAASELNVGSKNMSIGAEEQVTSIESTHSAILETRRLGDESLHCAQNAVTCCEKASITAKEGESAVDLVINAVKNISSSSSKIGSIISVIDEIAFQTNLLALNAAVEAARAGEQGRGFAVVAGEVRHLAQRSSVAAKEIKQLINEIIERVDYGTQVAGNAGAVLQKILTEVRSVNNEISDITQAIGSQRNGIESIRSTISVMERNTQATAAMSEQVAASAESMSNQSQQMLTLASSFKVS